MKKKCIYLFVTNLLLIASNLQSQVSVKGNWKVINDVALSTVTSDDDNGDGVGDGAIFVNGQSVQNGQGVKHVFLGTMKQGEKLNISTYTYNQNSSSVSYFILLYNATDAKVLVGASVSIKGGDTSSRHTALNYTTLSTDEGDVLEIHYTRWDDGSTARNFAIDNLSLNGQVVSMQYKACNYHINPDIALEPSNATYEADIKLMYSRYSDDHLGLSRPSVKALAAAVTAYGQMNISVSGDDISGNTVANNFSNVSYIRTFAQELKFNPGNKTIAEKANNTVWLVARQFCDGVLPLDHNGYEFRKFGQSAIFLKPVLEPHVINLYDYYMYVRFNKYTHFWEADYNHSHRLANRAIDTDWIYNHANIQLAYAMWFDTDKERLRYMKGFKRYLERFLSYTEGTLDGIKPDGSGYHHWNAYNNYLYTYKTLSSVLYYMRGTAFQINPDNYKVFRKAIYAQYVQANDARLQSLSSCGRNPHIRVNQMAREDLRRLSIAGGSILGLSTADPFFAGLYNRIYGVAPEFNYAAKASFDEGFVNLPYSTTGVFRKNNWVAVNKGFSRYLWGSEIYIGQNRFGRYQSYGALEILYPGDKTDNGYDVDTWDWNYNPGTTVIQLPWSKLHAERGRIDELQLKDFAGCLSFKNKNSAVLKENFGHYGMFAMDFQERIGNGWGAVHASENHNNSFVFKKTNFYFNDLIVCLGSGISNDDTSNPTVTTLYQRLDNGVGTVVNGSLYNSYGKNTFNGGVNNWVLNNKNTGFYLVAGDYDLKVKKDSQQTPNQTQIWPLDISSNKTATYFVAYLDHGTNPSNKSYEYILKPGSSTSEMQKLHSAIQGGNMPYVVHQQDAAAHVVEHKADKIWGYAFFKAAIGLNYNYVKAVDASCLVMTQYNELNKLLTLSASDPDIGLASKFDYERVPESYKTLTLEGQWTLQKMVDGVQILSASPLETVIIFKLIDGEAKEIELNKFVSTGVHDLTSESIKLHPNPCRNFFNIDSTVEIERVTITSMWGQEVINGIPSNNRVGIDGLQNGMYIVELQLANGKGTAVRKILIQN
ncbi:MAG: T9SS type A sorting domain-containing protein [Carboxylicivirga sp.]|jgi:hypothetical protein|nr:T9SS type A sorting domain-containing protein [Carboxylicivirga sp.]